MSEIDYRGDEWQETKQGRKRRVAKVVLDIKADPMRSTVNATRVSRKTELSPQKAGQALYFLLDEHGFLKKIAKTRNSTYRILASEDELREFING